MIHPSADLQKAIYTALAANANLTAALGGTKIYDHNPQEAAFPYVVIGRASNLDWSTSTEDGGEHVVIIHIWSERSDRMEIYQLQQEVQTSLHDATLMAVDHNVVNLRHEFSDVRSDDASNRMHGIMRFRAVTEPKV